MVLLRPPPFQYPSWFTTYLITVCVIVPKRPPRLSMDSGLHCTTQNCLYLLGIEPKRMCPITRQLSLANQRNKEAISLMLSSISWSETGSRLGYHTVRAELPLLIEEITRQSQARQPSKAPEAWRTLHLISQHQESIQQGNKHSRGGSGSSLSGGHRHSLAWPEVAWGGNGGSPRFAW